MTVLSADRYTKKKVGDIVEYPVYTGVVIYGGSIVCIGADGYARPGSCLLCASSSHSASGHD